MLVHVICTNQFLTVRKFFSLQPLFFCHDTQSIERSPERFPRFLLLESLLGFNKLLLVRLQAGLGGGGFMVLPNLSSK